MASNNAPSLSAPAQTQMPWAVAHWEGDANDAESEKRCDAKNGSKPIHEADGPPQRGDDFASVEHKAGAHKNGDEVDGLGHDVAMHLQGKVANGTKKSCVCVGDHDATPPQGTSVLVHRNA
jgi:hypothetical protein